MSASTWQAGVNPERRVNPDRRICHSILSQEALARIIVETRGADTHAGRALKELARRKQAGDYTDAGEGELIIYSLRGQWIVAPLAEAREAMQAAAAAACRRGKPSVAPPAGEAGSVSHH